MVALLAVLCGLNVLSARHKTVTYDEPKHFRYGLQILRGDAARFDDSKMPFSALNVLPCHISTALEPGAWKDWLGDPRNGRLVTMFFSVLLGVLVCGWARALYGHRAGLFALFLYVFSPNLLAHSRWITTDLYAAFTITLALFSFWRFLDRGGARRAVLAGAALGLAQLSKHTAILLYPLLLLIAVVRYAPHVTGALKQRQVRALARMGAGCLKWGALILLVSLVVINAGYLFHGTGAPLDAYTFRSDLFRELQSRVGFLGGIALPVPRPFLEGLDWTRDNDVTGKGRGPSYLLGETRRGRFDGYYLVVLLYKIPIPVSLLVGLALVRYVRRRRTFRFSRDEVCLILPAAFFVTYLNFFSSAQLGIRHLLMVLPLLHVLCGSLLRDGTAVGRRLRWAIGMLACYLVVSVMSYYPHFLSYFNELVLDRKMAYRVLADSNLDWGQNEKYAFEYVRRHPGTHLNPKIPFPGRALISANILLGIEKPAEYPHNWWLRQNLQPVAHVAYSYLVVVIPPEAVHEILKARSGQ
ncbi:MAG: glycosyltransferase family 39 protein [Planctomycetes bacterium]|nr:glycosyltransferase family 39 protein [Planctomycetota bacterium]